MGDFLWFCCDWNYHRLCCQNNYAWIYVSLVEVITTALGITIIIAKQALALHHKYLSVSNNVSFEQSSRSSTHVILKSYRGSSDTAAHSSKLSTSSINSNNQRSFLSDTSRQTYKLLKLFALIYCGFFATFFPRLFVEYIQQLIRVSRLLKQLKLLWTLASVINPILTMTL